MELLLTEKKSKTALPNIMRAAIHNFVKKGIDGTTVEDIARGAGVAEGALYRHFKGKDELAWHLFSTHLNQFTTDLMAKVLSESGLKGRLRVLVHECFAAFESDRDLFTFLILTEHRELQKYPESHMHPGHVALKIVEDGQKEGVARKGTPYLWASLIIGALIRACIVRMYGRIKTDLRKHSEEVSDALWSMVKE